MGKSFRIVTIMLLVCLVLTASVTAHSAQDNQRASGRFETKNAGMTIYDAYAFYSLEGKEKIIVAVSNQEFAKDAIDQYWDRKRTIERYYRDDSTAIIYFEFTPEGRYRGMSYYFGPGDGCGYCADPLVKSTVGLKDGRLSGKLSLSKEDDPKRWFELSLNVPLSDDDHGRSLGSGGGKLGEIYMAYHKALAGNDPKAIFALLSDRRRAAWEKAEKEGRLDEFLSDQKRAHPKELEVTNAYIKPGVAVILLKGKGETGKVTGEAQFVSRNDRWYFNDEAFSPAE